MSHPTERYTSTFLFIKGMYLIISDTSANVALSADFFYQASSYACLQPRGGNDVQIVNGQLNMRLIPRKLSRKLNALFN